MTLDERIAQAEEALHLLTIGKQVVRLRDSNGEEIQYTQASRVALESYVSKLKAQKAGTSSGPMRVYIR